MASGNRIVTGGNLPLPCYEHSLECYNNCLEELTLIVVVK